MHIFKKKKDVDFRALGDTGYHIKAVIDGQRLDIISWGYPVDKKTETKAGVKVSAESLEAEGQREKDFKGFVWNTVVFTPEYGYLPYETWKKIAKTVAGTLSEATGSTVTPSSIQIYASAPISQVQKCPKCGTPVFINFGCCQVCGTKFQ